MAVTALSLGQIEKLQHRATTARRYREQTALFKLAMTAVQTRWYDLPYEVREKITAICVEGKLAQQMTRTVTLADLVAIARLPFSLLKSHLAGEDFLNDYVMAKAAFTVALHERLRSEEESDRAAWAQITSGDAGVFAKATERGVAALDRGPLVEVDWTTVRPITR